MINGFQTGKKLDFTNSTGSDIASGDVVVIGGRVTVATNNIPDTKTGNLLTEEVVKLAKETSMSFAQGDRLYWDTESSPKRLTKTQTVVFAGIAAYAAGSSDTEAYVKLGVNCPQAATVAALGSTANLTAIAASFADLPEARTAVNTLKTETEARLDAIEGKVDAILTALKANGLMASA